MFNESLYNEALFNQAAVVGKLYPSGISQTIVIGTPTLKYPQWLYPSGIGQVVAIGTPLVVQVLYPSGINQVVAMGMPMVIISPLKIIRLYIAGVEVTGQVQLADFMIENSIDGISTSTVRIL